MQIWPNCVKMSQFKTFLFPFAWNVNISGCKILPSWLSKLCQNVTNIQIFISLCQHISMFSCTMSTLLLSNNPLLFLNKIMHRVIFYGIGMFWSSHVTTVDTRSTSFSEKCCETSNEAKKLHSLKKEHVLHWMTRLGEIATTRHWATTYNMPRTHAACTCSGLGGSRKISRHKPFSATGTQHSAVTYKRYTQTMATATAVKYQGTNNPFPKPFRPIWLVCESEID